MSTIYAKLNKEMREEYFSAIKLTGIGGIIVPYDKVSSSNLVYANNNGLSFWIEYNDTKKENLTYLDSDASGIVYFEQESCFASLDKLKEALKSFSKSDFELIDGIIVKYPKFSWLLWDESFKEDYYKDFSNYIEDYLYLLFEPTEKQSAFRSWYYEKCSEFIYKKYLSPLIKWSKAKGINMCFDIGNEESEYFYLRRHIDVFSLVEKGISLCVNHCPEGINETCIILSKYSGHSFVYTNNDQRLDGLKLNLITKAGASKSEFKKSSDKILLIHASRGVMQRCIKTDNDVSSVMENDSAISSLESTYYTDMLFEKGFNFEVTTEKLFEKHTKFKDGVFTYKDIKINQVLLCSSCAFTKKGITLLNKLLDGGICINNSNLIEILGSDLL